jgi:hypothetical protein
VRSKIFEMTSQEEEAPGVTRGWVRVMYLFCAALVGILASFFTSIAVDFLQLRPKAQTFAHLLELSDVSALGLVVQVILSIVVVTIVFPLIYVRVPLNSTEAPLLWLFLGFQNGFFSDALVGDVFAQFQNGGGTDQASLVLVVSVVALAPLA